MTVASMARGCVHRLNWQCRLISLRPKSCFYRKMHQAGHEKKPTQIISGDASRIAFLCKHFTVSWCYAKRDEIKANKNEKRNENEKKNNGSFAYKSILLSQIKCANQPQSKMIAVFFGMFFFFFSFLICQQDKFFFDQILQRVCAWIHVDILWDYFKKIELLNVIVCNNSIYIDRIQCPNSTCFPETGENIFMVKREHHLKKKWFMAFFVMP